MLILWLKLCLMQQREMELDNELFAPSFKCHYHAPSTLNPNAASKVLH